MRGVLVMCGIAVVVHIIPLLLPRNMPEQELAIARAETDAAHRTRYLLPLKQNDKATPADLREAAELLLEGAPADAHELAQEAERRDPKAVETQLLLARVCDAERMERCVQQSLSRAEQLAPGDARPAVLRADLKEQNGDLEGAAQALGQAHQKAPEDPLLSLRYGRLLNRMGRAEDALGVFQTLEGKVTHARLLVEQSLVRAKEGRDRDAVKLLQEAVRDDPRLAEGHFELGLAWFRLGNAEAAEDALRQADRLSVSDHKPLATLCALQVKAGQLEAARTSQMDLERRFPQRMDVIRELCRVP
jgi:tetratricopeptide (TPR) repeat protein